MKPKSFRQKGIQALLFLLTFGLLIGLSFGGTLAATIDVGENQQDIVIRGPVARAYLSEIATGDFNHDGIEDLLLGAAGHSGNGNVSGAVYMILGKGSLPATMDLAAANMANLMVLGPAAGSALGHSVAAGDVNNDGIDDMILAADNDRSGRGTVYVILGDTTRFATPTTTIDLALSTEGVALVIEHPSPRWRLGRSVASGDINGDGIDDIVMGAYQADPGDRAEAGAVYVVPGDESYSNAAPTKVRVEQEPVILTIYGAGGDPDGKLLAAQEAEAQPQVLLADEITAPAAGELGDRLGRSVAVADVNGDGIDDVVAGAYGANVGTVVDAGKTYVFFGSADYDLEADTVLDLGADPSLADLTANGINANDQSGFFVAAGDINGDGVADVVSSAYFADGANNDAADTGEVYVIYGGNSLPAAIDLAANADITIYGEAAGDRLGRSLAIGNINAVGPDDMILGSSRADVNGHVDAGKVYTIFGAGSLPNTILLSTPGSAQIEILGDGVPGVPCEPFEAGVVDCSDELGHSTGAGDINGDGADDILAGAIFANSGEIVDAGAIYIVYGDGIDSLDLTPESAVVKTGKSVSYRLTATNKFGSWDVTPWAEFSIDSPGAGSWDGNVFTANDVDGQYTVTGTYQGHSDTTLLTINYGTPVGITVEVDGLPVNAAGTPVSFAVFAYDQNGLRRQVTSEATFEIVEAGAGGFWTGNTYTTENAGEWTVRATWMSFSDTIQIQVLDPGAPQALIIRPERRDAVISEKVTYQAWLQYTSGMEKDVTTETTFSADGFGLFDGNVLTPSRTGTWEVVGRYGSLTGRAIITIYEPGQLVSLQVQISPALISAGDTAAARAWVTDSRNRTWEVTDQAAFSIDGAAGGSWAGNLYTSQNTGDWTVTGQFEGLTGTANLVVVSGEVLIQDQYLPFSSK